LENIELSPIILFVYNRLNHTKQTIKALQKNKLAKESELFIYSDAAKDEEIKQSVDEVRKYIQTVDGFKKVTIIEREKNLGLADSIIDGVTTIINEYGKIIVLEDDLVTSPYFLKFMNDALEFYKDEKKVWHISGWNYPIYSNMSCQVFLWKKMNCWGWATWEDRWQSFEKSPEKLTKEFDKEMILEFNLNGKENNWNQVLNNINGKINTWAVFWHTTIFKNNGLCVNPEISFVSNIGHDGSGIHCGNSCKKDITIFNKCSKIRFVSDIVNNIEINLRIEKYLEQERKPFYQRVVNKIFRFLFKKNLYE